MADRMDAMMAITRGEKTFWMKVGAAFRTKKGDGWIVRLEAVPAAKDGEVVIHLMEPRERSGGSGADEGPPF